MINEKDNIGNTPMHLAISSGNIDCCRFLIDRGADLTIKNNSNHTSLHYCIICSKPDVLDFILSHVPNIDKDIKGDFDATPLHYCAYGDDLISAKILVKHKVNIMCTCVNGYFPLHLAATRCSNNVFKFLLNESKKLGFTKANILSYVDADNNKPLHSSVQVNNTEIVKICLQNGSTIDETTNIDLLTPVHLACAQGSLDIIKVMFEIQPELKENVLKMQDAHLMTPLHKASMFDHVEIVEYLINNGADINALDKEKRSPILLAASRNCVKVVCYLLTADANIRLKDLQLRNFLHHIVSHTTPIKSSNENNGSLTDIKHAYDRKSDSSISIKDLEAKSSSVSVHAIHEVTKELIKVV
jgi:transient receptor potential cation channel subfamily A protein 1